MKHIAERELAAYLDHLRARELAPDTVRRYGRELRAFAVWQTATGGEAADYKQHLFWDLSREASGVNVAAAALNGFFAFAGSATRLQSLRVQKRTFLSQGRELTRAEYNRLLRAAEGNPRLWLLLRIRLGQVSPTTTMPRFCRQPLVC